MTWHFPQFRDFALMPALQQRHVATRIRHELRRRMLTVTSTELLTPHMQRFGFTSPDLHDFVSASHDDHIKLFFPGDGEDADGRKQLHA